MNAALNLPPMRGLLSGLGLLLLLSGCGESHRALQSEVEFDGVFPPAAPNLKVFHRQHRGVYEMMGDSSRQLCISARCVWVQRLMSARIAVNDFDSLGLPKQASRSLGQWQREGENYFRLRAHRPDTLLLDWWEPDTIFQVGPGANSRLRRLQGNYYLNTATANADRWMVQRLMLEGRELRWEQFGTDSLRMRVLPPGTIRHLPADVGAQWLVTPTSIQQVRQLGRYDGLWHGPKPFVRIGTEAHLKPTGAPSRQMREVWYGLKQL
jgi:hypothetical protein